MTYIWTGSGWLYLAVVLDLYARRVVGWAMSRSPDSELTKQALAVAYEARGCPEGACLTRTRAVITAARRFVNG